APLHGKDRGQISGNKRLAFPVETAGYQEGGEWGLYGGKLNAGTQHAQALGENKIARQIRNGQRVLLLDRGDIAQNRKSRKPFQLLRSLQMVVEVFQQEDHAEAE